MNLYNTWFIADTHFGHENMFKMRREAKIGGFSCSTLEEMNQMLIDNWNSRVKEKDFVVVVGDFVWKPKEFLSIVSKLNGQKILVTGNHDTRDVKKSDVWLDVKNILHLRLGETSNCPKKDKLDFYCCHYPIRDWNGRYHGSYHIYGHTHIFDMEDSRAFNVGVDVNIDPWKPKLAADIVRALSDAWFPDCGFYPSDRRVAWEKIEQNYNRG